MEGLFSDMDASAANGYALQLSTYALILQEKGYNEITVFDKRIKRSVPINFFKTLAGSTA